MVLGWTVLDLVCASCHEARRFSACYLAYQYLSTRDVKEEAAMAPLIAVVNTETQP